MGFFEGGGGGAVGEVYMGRQKQGVVAKFVFIRHSQLPSHPLLHNNSNCKGGLPNLRFGIKQKLWAKIFQIHQ